MFKNFSVTHRNSKGNFLVSNEYIADYLDDMHEMIKSIVNLFLESKVHNLICLALRRKLVLDFGVNKEKQQLRFTFSWHVILGL